MPVPNVGPGPNMFDNSVGLPDQLSLNQSKAKPRFINPNHKTKASMNLTTIVWEFKPLPHQRQKKTTSGRQEKVQAITWTQQEELALTWVKISQELG